MILNWFRINRMVANPGKFQIMFLGSNIDNSKIAFMIENKRVKSRSEVKLLGITICNMMLFTAHVENLCSTASNRLHVQIQIIWASKTSIWGLSTVLWSGCFVVNLQTILLAKSINAAYVLYMKWKMQISKIY